MSSSELPLPQDSFFSGLCCAADPGPLCPGANNYQREPSSLPSPGPQCVCFSNQTACETLDRERELYGVKLDHGGRLVKYCSSEVQLGTGASYNVPYFQTISVNGTGEIIMWAELQNGAIGPDPVTILTKNFNTPTGPFEDSGLADELNTVIQKLGVGALGTDLALNWACTGGPEGEASLEFTIEGGECLRPRLETVASTSSSGGGEESILTCVVGKLTPVPLGGCPSLNIFSGANTHYAINSVLIATVMSLWL